MKDKLLSNYGLWQSTICDYCQANWIHNENYVTYTVICTPEQVLPTDDIPEYHFIFQINENETIGLKISPNTSCIVFLDFF